LASFLISKWGKWLGGAERDRTADLVIANDALSQLSYSPKPRFVYAQAFGMSTREPREMSQNARKNERLGFACPLARSKLNRRRIRPEPVMRAILDLILLVLQLYTWVIIAMAILSWLIAFGVINIRNDFVRSVWNALLAVTEPILMPIRRRLPNLSGLDLSPVVLLLGIFLLERIIVYYVYPAAMGY
jgi:YggT family protein